MPLQQSGTSEKKLALIYVNDCVVFVLFLIFPFRSSVAPAYGLFVSPPFLLLPHSNQWI